MKVYTQYRKIAELISKQLSGALDSQEKEDFFIWLKEDNENELLFNKIKSKQNYSEWLESYQNTNTDKNWQKIYSDIKKEKRKYLIKNIYKYAATIAIIISSIVGIYFLFSLSFNNASESIVYNNPGESKAILTLNNGEIIELDSLDVKQMLESDGTSIMNEKGLISYSKSDNKAEKTLFNTIKIPRGGEYLLQLSDGSKVYLNSLTTLRFPVQFSGKIREVEISGEAYFEVVKLDSVPFIVKTNQSEIEVLGTSFNVNAYENSDKVITTLVRGKVKVKPNYGGAKPLILKPSEQSIFNISSNDLSSRKVDVEFYIAWTKGKFLFHDQRLEDIMEILCRWYTADVFYQNSSIKDLKFSGNLNRHDDIDQILEIIEATDKVRIEINNNTILFK